MRRLSALAFSACGSVPPGNVGIKVNNLGGDKGVSSEEVGVGYVWLGFFHELYLFPTFQQNYTWTKSPHEGNPADESITFQTKEGLEVNADFGISFAVDPTMVPKLFQTYRKGITEITDIFLRNNVRDAIVEISSTMSVNDISGGGKTELLKQVTERVKGKMKEVGIIVEQVYAVGMFRLPPNVTAALNSKIEAQQRSAQRENEVAEARAQADKDVAKAEGESKASLMRAEADAKANQKLAQSLTPTLVDYLKIQKWNGVLPTFSGNATPIINLSK